MNAMKLPHRTTPSFADRQRGVVLVFAMIALVILLIGAAAMMRSMNISLTNAGNFGFKRDLTNQSERALEKVFDEVLTGALKDEDTRQTTHLAHNYSAAMLKNNSLGLPLALLSDAEFVKAGVTSKDIEMADIGVKIRYVVDRLCEGEGLAETAKCVAADPEETGKSWKELENAETSSDSGRGAVIP